MVVGGEVDSVSGTQVTRGLSMFAMKCNPWFSWIGTNLYHNGTNFVKGSDYSGGNWGNIAGIKFDGTSGNTPAIRFVVDLPSSSSASYNHSLGSAVSAVDNKTAMSITACGNVGIGTDTPGAPLHVCGSWAGSHGQVAIEGPVNGLVGTGLRSCGAYKAFMIFRDGTGGNKMELGTVGDHPLHLQTNGHNNRLTILGGGNIGIGTSTPTAALEVKGGELFVNYQDTTCGGFLRLATNANASFIGSNFYYGTAFDGSGSQSGRYTASCYSQYLNFDTYTGKVQFFLSTAAGTAGAAASWTERFTICPAGIVYVQSTLCTGNKWKVTEDGVTSWGNSQAQGTLTWDTGKAVVGGLSGNALSLIAGGSSQLFICTGGNVGIGTDAPSVKLHVSGVTCSTTCIKTPISCASEWVVGNKVCGEVCVKTPIVCATSCVVTNSRITYSSNSMYVEAGGDSTNPTFNLKASNGSMSTPTIATGKINADTCLYSNVCAKLSTWSGPSADFYRRDGNGAYWNIWDQDDKRMQLQFHSDVAFFQCGNGSAFGRTCFATDCFQVTGQFCSAGMVYAQTCLHTNCNLFIGGNGGNAYDQSSTKCIFFGSENSGYNITSFKKAYTNCAAQSYTYNRLQLNWHTGIEIGANPLYGGVRFYCNQPYAFNSQNGRACQIMSVGDGDMCVRVQCGLVNEGMHRISQKDGRRGVQCISVGTISSANDSKLYRVGRMYANSAHWQNDGYLKVTAHGCYYGQTGCVTWWIQYGAWNNLCCFRKTAEGGLTHKVCLVMGSEVDTGTDYSGGNQLYRDICMCASNYTHWDVHFETNYSFKNDSTAGWTHTGGGLISYACNSSSGDPEPCHCSTSSAITSSNQLQCNHKVLFKNGLHIGDGNATYNSYSLHVKASGSTQTSFDPALVNYHVDNCNCIGMTISKSSSSTNGPDKVGMMLHNDNNTAGGFSPMLLFTKTETGSTYYTSAMAGIYARAPLGTGNSDGWIDGELIFATAGAASAGIKQRMVINKEGCVGIGITSPGTALSVVGAICATGDITAYASSDCRLKNNLKIISCPIDKIKAVSGYEFVWNTRDQDLYKGNDVGVIAQEVEKVLPQIVCTRDTGYKAIKYEKIVPLLIEATKEQQKTIEKQQRQIDTLTCQVDMLLKRCA